MNFNAFVCRAVRQTLRFFVSVALIIALPTGSIAQSLPSSVHPNLLTLTQPMQPVLLKGLRVHADDPFLFDFIVDSGDQVLAQDIKSEQVHKSVRYFLASLALPEKDLWVNLSPHEADRIMPDTLIQTEMGRDLLELDRVLKQLTSSLLYPESEVGRVFWQDIYKEAYTEFGTTDIPVQTFHKVWIAPAQATVVQDGSTALIAESRLDVFLEDDLVMHDPDVAALVGNVDSMNDAESDLATAMMRKVVLPALRREVNSGVHFAPLRQMFHALTLANWYRQAFKEGLLNEVYAEQARLDGIDLNDPVQREQVYAQYMRMYRDGVYDYIKEESTSQGDVPRHYFPGGTRLDHAVVVVNAASAPGDMLRQARAFRSTPEEWRFRTNPMTNGFNIDRETDSALEVTPWWKEHGLKDLTSGHLMRPEVNPRLKVNQVRLPREQNIFILFEDLNELKSFPARFLKEIQKGQYANDVRLVQVDSWDPDALQNRFSEIDLVPSMVLAPNDVFDEQRTIRDGLQEVVNRRQEALQVLFYESAQRNYPVNHYVPFDQQTMDILIEAMGMHKTQQDRTDYQKILELLARAAALREGKGNEYAHPLILKKRIDGKFVDWTPEDELLFSDIIAVLGLSPHPDDVILALGALVRHVLNGGQEGFVLFQDFIRGAGFWGVGELNTEQINEMMDFFKATDPEERRQAERYFTHLKAQTAQLEKMIQHIEQSFAEDSAEEVSVLRAFLDIDKLQRQIENWNVGDSVPFELMQLIKRKVRHPELEREKEVLESGLSGKSSQNVWMDYLSGMYPPRFGEAPEFVINDDANFLSIGLMELLARHFQLIKKDERDGKPFYFVGPHPEDSHPHHRDTEKILMKAFEILDSNAGSLFNNMASVLMQYLAPWAGGYNLYFTTDEEPDDESVPEYARVYEEALTHLVSELAGGFGSRSYTPDELGGKYTERFRSEVLTPDQSMVAGPQRIEGGIKLFGQEDVVVQSAVLPTTSQDHDVTYWRENLRGLVPIHVGKPKTIPVNLLLSK